MHSVINFLTYIIVNVVSCQNSAVDIGSFSALTLDVIPDAHVYHNVTFTTEIGCARVCHRQSHHCTGFLYKDFNCFLVSGSWLKTLSLGIRIHLIFRPWNRTVALKCRSEFFFLKISDLLESESN